MRRIREVAVVLVCVLTAANNSSQARPIATSQSSRGRSSFPGSVHETPIRPHQVLAVGAEVPSSLVAVAVPSNQRAKTIVDIPGHHACRSSVSDFHKDFLPDRKGPAAGQVIRVLCGIVDRVLRL